MGVRFIKYKIIRLSLLFFLLSCASLGINITGNEIYTDDEWADVLPLIDQVSLDVLDCAKKIYPNLDDSVFEQLTLEIVPPNGVTSGGTEYFNCTASASGKCTGQYSKKKKTVTVPPELAAYGHEVGHFLQHITTGNTSHDSSDLSIQCQVKFPCHLYAESRNLSICR